ncbi:hypothetical protein ACFY41_09205 [Streptomyces syringium]|uniref:hypothetical protein n=1 Tax=Streptomyces syringium TaxID=76729 RepID=UPI0036D12218
MASDAARASEQGFTAAGAARATATAFRSAGLDDRGAELIRLGENALFRLASSPVIVRVARSTEYLPAARNEVAVSRRLAREGLPAARVAVEAGDSLQSARLRNWLSPYAIGRWAATCTGQGLTKAEPTFTRACSNSPASSSASADYPNHLETIS